MRFRDHLGEVAVSFRKQKLRTALTACGIAIGAFAIAIMVGLGSGLQAYIEGQIRAFGNPRVLMVYPEIKWAEKFFDRLTTLGKPARPVAPDHDKDKRAMRGGVWLKPEDVEAIRKVPGVRSVVPFSWLEIDSIRLVGADGVPLPTQYECDFGTLASNPLLGDLTAGRMPEGRVTAEGAPGEIEVALSPQYAESFGFDPEETLGREVDLRVPLLANVTQRLLYSSYTEVHKVFRARVVGLSERSLVSRTVYVAEPPFKEMARYQSANPALFTEQKFGLQAQVRVEDGFDPETVKLEIRKLGLAARSVEDQIADVTKAFLVIDGALTSFGLIALVVATLGIVNTLLMAITERTREIGVMKALGATEGTIRLLFVIEAAAIGLLGGVIGVGAAVGLGSIANATVPKVVEEVGTALAGAPIFVFPWWLLAGAVGFTTAVGGLAGLYPSGRAARLDPIQALRYE